MDLWQIFGEAWIDQIKAFGHSDFIDLLVIFMLIIQTFRWLRFKWWKDV